MDLYQELNAALSQKLGIWMVVYIDNILLMADTKVKARDQASSLPGLHSEHRKDGIGIVLMYRIPEFHIRHNQDGIEFASSKDEEDLGRVPTVIRGGAYYSPCPLQINWQNECHDTVIPQAPLFYGNLQMDLAAALRRADKDYETVLNLSLEELTWWDTQMVKWNGRMVMATDPT